MPGLEQAANHVQVKGMWPSRLAVESLTGSGRVTASGLTSSFQKAAGAILLDGTPIGEFEAASPAFAMELGGRVRFHFQHTHSACFCGQPVQTGSCLCLNIT